MLMSDLLGLLTRATLLMGFGLLAARLAERRSAILSHRILTATGLCVILFPVVAQWGPRWEWSQPSWLTACDTEVRVAPASEVAVTQPLAADLVSPLPVTPIAQRSSSVWMFANLPLQVWIIGSLLMMARLTYAILRLRAMLSASVEALPAMLRRVNAMASDLHIRQRVSIRIGYADSMPMVCWLGGWILVLPSNFDGWEEDLKQATLAHEFGHIARRDVWVDYAIQGLSCLLWWHPLMWIMARNITRLRELACDEWVLQSTPVSARDYAHSLLAVVRLCQIQRMPLATPMATQSELESRLQNISSPHGSQRIRRIWLALGAIGIALLAASLAAISLVNDKTRPSKLMPQAAFGEETPPSDTGGCKLTGVVTYEGNPVAGIKVKLIHSLEGKPNQVHAIVSTDDQGRYTIPGLHPGDRYTMEVQPKGTWMVRNWNYQSPYVNVITAKEGETIELPDANMVNNNQVLRGLVVDPTGKPVRDISVTANLASGGMLSRTSAGESPWTQTDENGRFELTNLPNEAIELMTYKQSPTGGRIKHPCKVTVGLNQTDIRIVYDPKLGTGIEDLDAK